MSGGTWTGKDGSPIAPRTTLMDERISRASASVISTRDHLRIAYSPARRCTCVLRFPRSTRNSPKTGSSASVHALLLGPRPKGIGKLPLGVAAYLIPSGSLPEPYVSVPIDRWIQVQPLMRGCVVEGDMRVGPNFPSVLDGCGDERLGSMVGVQELRVWL